MHVDKRNKKRKLEIQSYARLCGFPIFITPRDISRLETDEISVIGFTINILGPVWSDSFSHAKSLGSKHEEHDIRVLRYTLLGNASARFGSCTTTCEKKKNNITDERDTRHRK